LLPTVVANVIRQF